MDRRVDLARAAILAASIVIFAAAVTAGCGDSADRVTTTETVTSTVEGTGPIDNTTTGTEDGATPPADVEVSELTGFTSPSGNIGCIIDPESVRCDIDKRDWRPPQASSSCKLDYGQGIELDAGGAPGFVCAGDTTLGSGDPLPYGESIAAGLLRCESAESGITCSDIESGRGFMLSIESFELG